MKRSRGYFCKVNNQLDDAFDREAQNYMHEVVFGVPYNPKMRRKLILKLTLRDDDSLWWMS